MFFPNRLINDENSYNADNGEKEVDQNESLLTIEYRLLVVVVLFSFILSIVCLVSHQPVTNYLTSSTFTTQLNEIIFTNVTSDRFETVVTNSKLVNLRNQIASIDNFLAIGNEMQVGTINCDNIQTTDLTLCGLGGKKLVIEPSSEVGTDTQTLTIPCITGRGMLENDGNGILSWNSHTFVNELPDGSLESPSLSFENNSSMGIYRNNVTNAMHLTSTGLVSQVQIEQTGVIINGFLKVGEIEISGNELSGLTNFQTSSIQSLELTDGVLSMSNGVITDATSITSNLISDGVATLTNGDLSDVNMIECNTLDCDSLTSGGLSIQSGNISTTGSITCDSLNSSVSIGASDCNVSNQITSSSLIVGENVVISSSGIVAPSVTIGQTTSIESSGIVTPEVSIGNMSLTSTGIGSINNSDITILPDVDGNINLNINGTGQLLTNLTNPTSQNSLVTKGYVDNFVQGLILTQPVRVKTTVSLPSYNFVPDPLGIGFGVSYIEASSVGSINSIGIDDVTDLQLNQRVLVTSEATMSDNENGIYEITSLGDGSSPWRLTRSLDKMKPNTFIFVENGTINTDSGWGLIVTGLLVIDVTDIIFTQVSRLGSISISNIGGQTGIYSSQNGSIFEFKTLEVSSPLTISELNDVVTIGLDESLITTVGNVSSGSIVSGFGSIEALSLSDGVATITAGDINNVSLVSSNSIINQGTITTSNLIVTNDVTCDSLTSNSADLKTVTVSGSVSTPILNGSNSFSISNNAISHIDSIYMGLPSTSGSIQLTVDNPSSSYPIILPNSPPSQVGQSLVVDDLSTNVLVWGNPSAEIPFFNPTSTQLVAFVDETNVLHTFTAPKNASELHVKLWGAGGGASGYIISPLLRNGTNGGYTTCKIPVSEGDQFVVSVGLKGSYANQTSDLALIGGIGGVELKSNFTYSSGSGGAYTSLHSYNPSNGEYTLIACAGGGAGGILIQSSEDKSAHSSDSNAHQIPNNYPSLTLTTPSDFGGNGADVSSTGSPILICGGGGYTGGENGYGGGGYTIATATDAMITTRDENKSDSVLTESSDQLSGFAGHDGLAWLSFTVTVATANDSVHITNDPGNYIKLPVLTGNNKPKFPTNGMIIFDEDLNAYVGYVESTSSWVILG